MNARQGAGSGPDEMSGTHQPAENKNHAVLARRHVRISAFLSASGLKRDLRRTNLSFSPSALHSL